jgi:pimeloyl-ACP methyl ester carboxylesterase
MAPLAYSRIGAGAPLVLVHALGLDRSVWDPVLPALARRFDVIAVDLPGFGDSEPLPPSVEPTPAALAGRVALLLDELGIRSPHVAGNSLGGWVALELAALRPVASLALLAPAGLWRGGTPLYCRISLQATRWLSVHAGGLLSRLVGFRWGRVLVLGQSHGRPGRLTAAQARATIRAIGTAPGFDAALAATLPRHYVARTHLDVPVTVAFGSRDLVLLRHRSRHLEQLPADVRLAALPHCGHIPFADDPAAVSALITAAAGRALSRTTGRGRARPGGQGRNAA